MLLFSSSSALSSLLGFSCHPGLATGERFSLCLFIELFVFRFLYFVIVESLCVHFFLSASSRKKNLIVLNHIYLFINSLICMFVYSWNDLADLHRASVRSLVILRLDRFGFWNFHHCFVFVFRFCRSPVASIIHVFCVSGIGACSC